MKLLRPLHRREKQGIIGFGLAMLAIVSLGFAALWTLVFTIDVDASERVEFFEQHVTQLETEIGRLDLGLGMIQVSKGSQGVGDALQAAVKAEEVLQQIITLTGDAPWASPYVFSDLLSALNSYQEIIYSLSDEQGGIDVDKQAILSGMRQTIGQWRQTAEHEAQVAQAYVYQQMDRQSGYLGVLVSASIVSFSLFGVLAVVGGSYAVYLKVCERRWRESCLQYRQIFTSSQAIALLVDPRTGRIVDANAAAAEFYGWSIAHLRTLEVGQINTLNQAEIEREMAVAAREQRSHFYFTHRLADGRVREVEVHTSPIDYDGSRLLYSVIHDITERRDAERALRSSEQRYSNVINSSSQGFLMVAPNSGVIIDINGAMCQLLGREREEVVGVSFLDFIVEEDLAKAREAYAGAHRERHRQYEVKLSRPDGGHRLTSFHATSLFDENDVWVGSYAFVEDISQRRLSEQRLRDSQGRLEAAIRAGNIGVWTYQPDEDVMTFSSEWKAQLGYSDLEFPDSRERWKEVIHPDDRVRSEAAWADLMAERVPGVVQTERYLHRSGHWVYVRSCALLVRDTHGLPQSIIGAHVDLTPQYEIQETLARANARNALILDSASDGLLGVDDLGRVTMVNAACQRLLGFVAKDIIGRDAEEFLHPSKPDGTAFPADEMPIISVLNSGRARPAVTALVWRRDGVPLPVELGVAPMMWQGKVVGAIVNFHDISEALRYRADLERSNNELEQFAYMASHDLQEPLRTVSSYLTLLRRRYSSQLDSDGQEFIGIAVDGANRMATMIRDLLDYSRVGRRGGEMQPTALRNVVDAALANLKIAIDDLDAKVEIKGPLPVILADAVQMTSLFQNLIGNAMKYRDPSRRPEVCISAERWGSEGVSVSVSDNGIGIESDYFDRIFQPFQRLHTRESYEGNGIGLAICRKIVERHGGHMTVSSQPGQGSSFAFTLPELVSWEDEVYTATPQDDVETSKSV